MPSTLSAGVISAEHAQVHPLRYVVTCAVSGKPDLYVDIDEADTPLGDQLLLCSGGVHGPHRHAKLSALVTAPDAITGQRLPVGRGRGARARRARQRHTGSGGRRLIRLPVRRRLEAPRTDLGDAAALDFEDLHSQTVHLEGFPEIRHPAQM